MGQASSSAKDGGDAISAAEVEAIFLKAGNMRALKPGETVSSARPQAHGSLGRGCRVQLGRMHMNMSLAPRSSSLRVPADLHALALIARSLSEKARPTRTCT